ncbi:MAG: hypothetical protein NTZ73_02875 [Candidatus Diapherotrites archaeon]|nr:hypothetical protein [Candidatus Diapherotrites archaeon]
MAKRKIAGKGRVFSEPLKLMKEFSGSRTLRGRKKYHAAGKALAGSKIKIYLRMLAEKKLSPEDEKKIREKIDGQLERISGHGKMLVPKDPREVLLEKVLRSMVLRQMKADGKPFSSETLERIRHSEGKLVVGISTKNTLDRLKINGFNGFAKRRRIQKIMRGIGDAASLKTEKEKEGKLFDVLLDLEAELGSENLRRSFMRVFGSEYRRQLALAEKIIDRNIWLFLAETYPIYRKYGRPIE